jgi:heat shock protein HtpX
VLNQTKTIVLLGSLSALLVGFGSLLGPGWTITFGVLAVVLNIGAYFFSDRLVLRMHGARPLAPAQAPRLFETVGDLSARAGIPMPRLFLVDDPHANAFATGRNPEHGVVAVTTGLLERLSFRELRGVLAHEIGHIRNRDILVSSVAAAMAGAITYAANALQWTTLLGGGSSDDEEGGSPAGGLLVALVAPLAASLVQMGISRSREFMADELGARISGDPGALADALERLEASAAVVPGIPEPATASLFIVNPFAGAAGLLRLFSTHPPTAERVRRLREMTSLGLPVAA